MKPYQLLQGDCREVLKTLPDNSVDSIVTDPPYELGFMGKAWDATGVAYDANLWREAYRVLKPGGHILSFGGSRTYHRMACAIEDAGFEVRDQLMWVYGSGFPKSHNISKALNKAAGVQYETKPAEGVGFMKADGANGYNPTINRMFQVGQSSAAAKQWDGWGTALKPAHEPIVLARKPLEGTVVDNVRKWGVGGLNIDGCRVEFVSEEDRQESVQKNQHADFGSTMGSNQVYGDYSMLKPQNYAPLGRFPANLMHDGSQEVLELFPQSKSTGGANGGKLGARTYGKFSNQTLGANAGGLGDEGSAARFFYCPKASKKDRDEGCEELPTQEKPAHMRTANGEGEPSMTEGFQPTQRKNTHPTVKPTELMRYLVRLITPKGGLVLDPFNGSGSTGKASMLEGMRYIGIEMNPEYIKIAEARISNAIK